MATIQQSGDATGSQTALMQLRIKRVQFKDGHQVNGRGGCVGRKDLGKGSAIPIC